MPTEAIDHYHSLLQQSSNAQSANETLQHEIESRRLYFRTRPVTNVLRPRFLTPARYQFIQSRTRILSEAILRVHGQAVADPAFRHWLGVQPWEEEWLNVPTGFDHPSPIVRFDGFYALDGRLRFVELNTQSPAGAGFADGLTEAFQKLPVVQQFTKQFQLTPLPCRAAIRAAILWAFQQWCRGRSLVPRVAIVDWSTVATRAEFDLIRDEFSRAGIFTIIADPAELEYDGHQLMASGEPINLVYRRVLTPELLDRHGARHPLFRAAREQAVCIVNPFPCRVTGKKATFAILSDERFAALFTPIQRAAAREHIPWTRLMEDRETVYLGRTIELPKFVAANRERLVLKPNDNYGGQKVVLGWLVTDTEWAAAIEVALRERYVVQVRIELPQEDYPAVIDGQLQITPRWVDTGPFVGPDQTVFSCITRLSTDPVVNVTAGGGCMVPTFLVEPV